MDDLGTVSQKAKAYLATGPQDEPLCMVGQSRHDHGYPRELVLQMEHQRTGNHGPGHRLRSQRLRHCPGRGPAAIGDLPVGRA
jgi:hypothetical protein